MSAEVVKRPERTNATKQKIFEASMVLIGERGASEVSVDEIAAAAKVSKGTVYYNFGSKAELIAQLIQYGVSLLEPQLEVDKSLPSREGLMGVFTRILEFFEQYPSFSQLIVSEMWRTPSQWQHTITQVRERIVVKAGYALERVVADHHTRTDIPAEIFISLSLWTTLLTGLDRQVFHPDRSRDVYVKALTAMIDGYLQPRAAGSL